MAPAHANRSKRQRRIGTAVLRVVIVLSALCAFYIIVREPLSTLLGHDPRDVRLKASSTEPAGNATTAAATGDTLLLHDSSRDTRFTMPPIDPDLSASSN